MTDTLHEDQCTFMIVSHRFILEMRNVLDKSCREYRNIHFMFDVFFFSKIATFVREWGRIWYSQRGHR
jgi:hypothetical protein